MINSELKDKIEDALIHFEDKGYSFQIQYDFFCNDRSHNRFTTFSTNKVYDMLKKGCSNEETNFGDRLFIRLQRNSIMNWGEYQWFHNELKVAISRMVDSVENIEIKEGETTDISIKFNSWKFKNIKELVEKTKYFNANSKKINKIIVYPEYHTEEGIVLYVREIPDGTEFKRFSLLDSCIKPEYYDDKKEEVINGNKVTTVTTRERQFVSLERAFGKNCVIKRYEEGEAEKENEYLKGSSLSKYIVAKINCDFIKV